MKVTIARRKARIEMLPLIDIVFLLLVVFIFAMLSMAVHRGLPVDLPKSSTASPGKELILAVTIQEQEYGAYRIFVDEQEVDIEALGKVLQTRAAEMQGKGRAAPGVLLFADRSVVYQQIFAVLDRIQQAGFSKISLQADVEK